MENCDLNMWNSLFIFSFHKDDLINLLTILLYKVQKCKRCLIKTKINIWIIIINRFYYHRKAVGNFSAAVFITYFRCHIILLNSVLENCLDKISNSQQTLRVRNILLLSPSLTYFGVVFSWSLEKDFSTWLDVVWKINSWVTALDSQLICVSTSIALIIKYPPFPRFSEHYKCFFLDLQITFFTLFRDFRLNIGEMTSALTKNRSVVTLIELILSISS